MAAPIGQGIQNPPITMVDSGTLVIAEGAAASVATVESDVSTLTDRVTALEGTRWMDVPSPAIQAAGAAALTQEAYRATTMVVLKMRHDQDDTLYIQPEVAHGWVIDSECRVHLHYIPMVTPAADQTVVIQYSYCWAHVGAELPDAAGWTNGTATFIVPASGVDTFMHKLVQLFSTTPTGGSAASILNMRITRLSSSASDTYTTSSATGTAAANLVVLAIGMHIQVDALGTVSETA